MIYSKTIYEYNPLTVFKPRAGGNKILHYIKGGAHTCLV